MFMQRKTQYYKYATSSHIGLYIQHHHKKKKSQHIILWIKFVQKDKRPRIANTIPKKQNNFRGMTIPDIKNHYKDYIIKTIYYSKRVEKQIIGIKQPRNRRTQMQAIDL